MRSEWRSIETLPHEVVDVYPHDPEAFTQGLFFEDGFLFEGTGLRGRSSLRRVELKTGKVIQAKKLPKRYFGEGITCINNRIYQLTWQSGQGFIYDKDTFRQLGSFAYPGEGWGLTHDGSNLIMSNGSAILTFLDPETMQTTRKIQVHADTKPVDRLNELEFVKGYILANILYADDIVVIAADTGRVVGRIDCSDLMMLRADKTRAVLNGIAYDPAGDRLFVTGKLWPK